MVTKVTSIFLKKNFEKAAQVVLFGKKFLQNVYVSLSGAAEHPEGAFKTRISSDGEKSFTTPKEVPLTTPAFFSPPLQ